MAHLQAASRARVHADRIGATSSRHARALAPKQLSARRSRSVAVNAVQTGGMLQKLGRVLKEKAQSDLNRVFTGTSKTREKLGVRDESNVPPHACMP